MIIFGILAHFMARSTYQPYGARGKRRGGNGRGGSSLFGDLGGGPGGGPGSSMFGDNMNDWYGGGSPFANFPPPPGMGRPGGPGGSGATGGDGMPSMAGMMSGMPTA